LVRGERPAAAERCRTEIDGRISESAKAFMNIEKHSKWDRGWALCAAAVFLIAGSLLAAGRPARVPQRTVGHASIGTSARFQRTPARSSSNSYFQVRSYFLDFAGDHSLDAATVTEQTSAGYANYTVELRLASGAEQSVVVSAPPGGLQIEMQDMTGDHVPNDVILRPALPRWPPTVLVNDGHDHFAVVESSTEAGFFSSRENLDPRRRNGQTFAYLRSSGFKAIHLPPSKRTLAPTLQQSLLSPFNRSFARRMEDASRSGRAPPTSLAV
jgi:hypothetical protein